MDIHAYAEKHAKRTGPRCATCQINQKVRATIAEAKEDNPSISWPTLSDWLKEKHKIKIAGNALRNHFVSGHEERT